jgi:hypothetical protein
MIGAGSREQRGMSLWSWLYVLATLGLMLMVGIKAVPVYLNNYDIRATLEWAASQPDLREAPAIEIQERIQRRFDSGYVDNVTGRDVKVKRVDEGRRLSVEYEVRRAIVANVTLLFEFHESAVLPGR